MFLLYHLYLYFMYWIVCAGEDQVNYNHGLETKKCMTSMINVSYNQCLKHFTSNVTHANVIVYKRKFLLCNAYIVFGTIEYKKEPGTILVYVPKTEARDCLALFENGSKEDGVYVIQPVNGSSVETWCDMTNGGWTVIQRRMDGSEDFYRTWTDYVQGFGNRNGEYWIGLENIFELTSIESSLKIEMETFGDVLPTKAYATYQEFKVENEASNYRLYVSGFSGNCGDSFLGHNGNMFTTKDNDNDQWPGNCAISFKGAWWYSECHSSNLNGLYLSGNNTQRAVGMVWFFCWGHNYSIRNVVMKVKRSDASNV